MFENAEMRRNSSSHGCLEAAGWNTLLVLRCLFLLCLSFLLLFSFLYPHEIFPFSSSSKLALELTKHPI